MSDRRPYQDLDARREARRRALREGDAHAHTIPPEPVLIEVVRLCHFKAKPCRNCGRAPSAHHKTKGEPDSVKHIPGVCVELKRQNGCDECGRNKGDVAHFGAPRSYNAFGSGRGTSASQQVGATEKQTWQAILRGKLEETSLPKGRVVDGAWVGLAQVYAIGEITFPDDRDDRDQGNFRVVLEKALGDALEQGGYLERDNWRRYSFGDLSMRVVPGQSATRLLIYQAFPPRPPFPHPDEQMEMI